MLYITGSQQYLWPPAHWRLRISTPISLLMQLAKSPLAENHFGVAIPVLCWPKLGISIHGKNLLGTSHVTRTLLASVTSFISHYSCEMRKAFLLHYGDKRPDVHKDDLELKAKHCLPISHLVVFHNGAVS